MICPLRQAEYLYISGPNGQCNNGNVLLCEYPTGSPKASFYFFASQVDGVEAQMRKDELDEATRQTRERISRLSPGESQQVTSAPSKGSRSEVVIEFNDVPAEHQRLAKIIWRSVALGEQCYDSLLPSLEEMRVRISQDPMSDFDSGFGLYPRMRRTPVRPEEVRARLASDLEAQIDLCRHFLADAGFPNDVAIECRWVTYGTREMGYLEFSCDEKRLCFEPVFLRYGEALRIESIMPLARIRVAPEGCSVAIAFTPLSLGQVFSGRMRVPLPGHVQMPSFLWVFRFNTRERDVLIERMPAVVSNAVLYLQSDYRQFQPHLPKLAVDQSAVDVTGTEAVKRWEMICGQLGITMDLKEFRLECLRCYTSAPALSTQPSVVR